MRRRLKTSFVDASTPTALLINFNHLKETELVIDSANDPLYVACISEMDRTDKKEMKRRTEELMKKGYWDKDGKQKRSTIHFGPISFTFVGQGSI